VLAEKRWRREATRLKELGKAKLGKELGKELGKDE